MAPFTSKNATRIPRATYRLQLNKEFKFTQADRITSYLKRLGISDCYSSPILKARRGSMHCYDVVDHEQINPELGSWNEFSKWIQRLHSFDMGLVLDIVPNHMAISDENPLLTDVLEYGPFSKYSDFFDIDWKPPQAATLRNRLILPILRTDLSEGIRNRDLFMTFAKEKFWLHLYSSRFPLTPKSYARIFECTLKKLMLVGFPDEEALKELGRITKDFAKLPDSSSSKTKHALYPFAIASKKKGDLRRLCSAYPAIENTINQVLDEFRLRGCNDSKIETLLHEQFYKLEFWRTALNKLNYRRFALVNDLIAIREERSQVFKEAHGLVMKLIASKKINGLRIDHIDGLYHPSEYLVRLQRSCQSSLLFPRNTNTVKTQSSSAIRRHIIPFYVVVEKILGEGENIPQNWRIHGTTGYEFLYDLNNLFIEHKNSSKFDRIYSNFVSHKIRSFKRVVEASRRRVIESSMKRELSSLTDLWADIAKDLPSCKNTSKEDMRVAIKEIAVCFPVYRTYSNMKVSATDLSYIEKSTKFAISNLTRKKAGHDYCKVIDNLRTVLLLQFPANILDSQMMKWKLFCSKFQQFTAPIAAKGIEDTAFYIYNKLISLNEVGGYPESFGISVEEFHKRNVQRLESHPHSLLASSTHDTKRSEDVRARINVLSELPDKWNDAIFIWCRLNKSKKSIVHGELCPSKNDEYMLYQTMIGIWPLKKVGVSEKEELLQRISSFMKKAVREAKVHTSWVEPNLEYERALDNFIEAILGETKHTTQFVSSFHKFQMQVSYYGMLNSLSQLLMKLTCPGVPDIYQGNELWDFSLVDPDNRRPVNFSLRARMLSSLERRIRRSGSTMDDLARDLVSNMSSGLIKMFVLHQSLKFRSDHEELFKSGKYIPVQAHGAHAEHVCAFMRKSDNDHCIVIGPRLYVSLLNDPKYDSTKDLWNDTQLVLPERSLSNSHLSYSNIFTERKAGVRTQDGKVSLPLSDVLNGFPVAILVPQK
jgi:(1->4)-alpha-D-glucan 1-alpha-D-glucosylmutase